MIAGYGFTERPPVDDHLTHLQVEVTWRCNWRCVHCYQDDHRREPLSTDDLLTLWKQASGLGVMHLIVTGGEPLVRRDIFELLAAARDEGLGITLYTNGHRVDREAAARIAPLVGTVELSLLAGDEEIHDTLTRVRGSYRRAWEATDLLREHDVPVVLKTPVLRPAYGTLRHLEHEALIRQLQWTADPEISPSYAGQHYPLKYRLNQDEMRQFYEDFPQFSSLAGFNLDPGVRDGMCLAGRNYLFVDALGNAYPCLNFKTGADARETAGDFSGSRMGNILTSELADIWAGNTFVKRIRAMRVSDVRSCSACASGGSCKPCIALNYEETGSVVEPSPRLCDLNRAMAGTHAS